MPPPASTNERAPGDGYLVLWAATSTIEERDAQVELRRGGVRVEAAPAAALVDRARERAPDLVVLGGELGEAPTPLVRQLGAACPTIPILALVPTEKAAPRPRSRYGLVARLDRALSPPALASRLTSVLAALSRRAPVWRVSAQSGDLAQLAARFARAGHSGILTADDGALAIDATRGSIAPGAPSSSSAESAGALTAFFHERPRGRVRTDVMENRAGSSLEGARVLLVDADAQRRERMARRLESAGAQVRATELAAKAVHASRALDPMVIVVLAAAMGDAALTPIWREPRLAAASLLVLEDSALESAALEGTIGALVEDELALGRRLRAEEAIAERLETLGPARWLKLLGPCTHEVTLRVFAAAGRARVDLAGGRIQGASFRPHERGASVIDGRPAVDALMAMAFGRVLAGPPHALAALDGASRRRKPSVVGRIEPTPPVSAPRGRVAREIVLQHKDHSSDGRAAPLRRPLPASVQEGDRPSEPRAPARPPLPAADRSAPAVTFTDLADGPELETRNYSRETLEALRAELETPDREPEREAPARAQSEHAETARTAPEPAEPERATPEPPEAERAHTEKAELQPAKTDEDESQRAAPEPAETERAETNPPEIERTPTEKAEPKPPEVESKTVGLDAGEEAEREVRVEAPTVEVDPNEREDADAPPSGPPLATPELAAHDALAPRGARGKSLWLAAAIALALGAGGWAAWHLQEEPDEPSERSVQAASHPAPQESPALDVEPDEPADRSVRAASQPAPQESPRVEVEPPEAAAPEQPAEPADEPLHEAQPSESAAPDPSPSEPPADDEALGTASLAKLIELAREAIREGDYARSERLSRRALELSPRDPRAGYRLAVALFRLERDREAIAQCELTSRWDPEDPLPLALIGDIHGRRGRFRLAARAYRRALEADPRFEPAERALARLARRGIQ